LNRDEAWKIAEGDVGPNWGIFDASNVMNYGADVFGGATMADNWSCSVPTPGAGTPSISFTYPPIGSSGSIMGQEEHVAPSDYYVAVYILVGSGWWTKPTFAQPREHHPMRRYV